MTCLYRQLSGIFFVFCSLAVEGLDNFVYILWKVGKSAFEICRTIVFSGETRRSGLSSAEARCEPRGGTARLVSKVDFMFPSGNLDGAPS